MRRLAVLAIGVVVGGCAVGPGASELATSSPVAVGTQAPTSSVGANPTTQPSAGATPEATIDSSLLQAALAFASGAGIEVAAGATPVATNQRPEFDPTVLRRLSLPLSDEGDLTLDVFLDQAGRIRVVTDGFYDRPPGDRATKAEILAAGRRYLDLAGIDLLAGELHVAAGPVAGRWYLTFDREIGGYDVANTPMSWGLAGDKTYLELRSDASLAVLYAFQPENRPDPHALSPTVLEQRLATAADRSVAELRALEPGFLWIRAQDLESGVAEDVLTLGYCATKRSESGWEAWCVDAATGVPNARGFGVD